MVFLAMVCRRAMLPDHAAMLLSGSGAACELSSGGSSFRSLQHGGSGPTQGHPCIGPTFDVAPHLMHVPPAVQHRWYTSVLLGHYGYYGRPQNFPTLTAFRQEVLRIWLTCLRRRSLKTRPMNWQTYAAADKLPPSNSSDHPSLAGSRSMAQVILGKSRAREICMPGSVRAKAEWLSYSTIPVLATCRGNRSKMFCVKSCCPLARKVKSPVKLTLRL